MDTQREISETARGFADRLKDDGRQQVETRKRTAADSIAEVASALGRAGEQLQSQPTLASYANDIAGRVNSIAERIRDGSVEELVDDTRRLARANPGLFVLGSFAAGVALSRFLKASESSVSYDSDHATSGAAAGTSGGDYGGEFAEASASQSAYPSQAYSPSTGTTEQGSTYTSTNPASTPYTPPSGG